MKLKAINRIINYCPYRKDVWLTRNLLQWNYEIYLLIAYEKWKTNYWWRSEFACWSLYRVCGLQYKILIYNFFEEIYLILLVDRKIIFSNQIHIHRHIEILTDFGSIYTNKTYHNINGWFNKCNLSSLCMVFVFENINNFIKTTQSYVLYMKYQVL